MITLAKLGGLLTQVGLVFELSGVFMLAMPGLRVSTRQRIALAHIGLTHAASFLFGFLATCTGAAAAVALLYYDVWRPAIWALSLIVYVAWMPAIVRTAWEGSGDIGVRPTDQQVERLHLRGLILLAIGFAIQGLAMTLS